MCGYLLHYSIWRVAKIELHLNVTKIPNQLCKHNEPVNNKGISKTVASYFDTKIREVASSVEIDKNIYNERRLVNIQI
jgi:hypothetical protein